MLTYVKENRIKVKYSLVFEEVNVLFEEIIYQDIKHPN